MTDLYLQHHGVKGMKWGVRKKVDAVGVNVKGKRYGVTKGDVTAFGANAAGRNRQTAKRHNLKIKEDYQTAKNERRQAASAYRQARSAYRQARSARVRNLAGRAVTQTMGFTDSGRGSYYRHRAAGEGKVTSALKAYGRQYVTNVEMGAQPLGTAVGAGEMLLRKKGIIK